MALRRIFNINGFFLYMIDNLILLDFVTFTWLILNTLWYQAFQIFKPLNLMIIALNIKRKVLKCLFINWMIKWQIFDDLFTVSIILNKIIVSTDAIYDRIKIEVLIWCFVFIYIDRIVNFSKGKLFWFQILIDFWDFINNTVDDLNLFTSLLPLKL